MQFVGYVLLLSQGLSTLIASADTGDTIQLIFREGGRQSAAKIAKLHKLLRPGNPSHLPTAGNWTANPERD